MSLKLRLEWAGLSVLLLGLGFGFFSIGLLGFCPKKELEKWKSQLKSTGSCMRKGWAQWVSVLWIMELVQTRWSALPFPPKGTFNSLPFGESPCRVFLDLDDQELDVCSAKICFHRTRVVWAGRHPWGSVVEFPHHGKGLLSLTQVAPSPVWPDGFNL